MVYVKNNVGKSDKIIAYHLDCGIPDSSTCDLDRVSESVSDWTTIELLQVLPRTSSTDDLKILIRDFDANVFVLLRLGTDGELTSGTRFHASSESNIVYPKNLASISIAQSSTLKVAILSSDEKELYTLKTPQESTKCVWLTTESFSLWLPSGWVSDTSFTDKDFE